MNFLVKIVFSLIPLFFITQGIYCIFKSKKAYRYNLKQVDDFAKSVKNIPVLGFIAEQRASQTKFLGKWLIKIWGISALIIGLLVLYSIIIS